MDNNLFFFSKTQTCGSDKVIKVWGKGEGGKWVLQAELQGHTGSVWKVCWAHPIYGPAILASCSADKTVKIWEERVDPEAKNPWIWKRRAQFLESRESVESIEFAPKHLGLKLATGSSDGWIRIYKTENQLDVAHWQCEHKFLIRPLKNNTSIKSMESSAVSRTGDVGLTCLSWSKSQFDDAMIVIGCASGSPQIWGHNKSFRKWQILSVCNSCAQLFSQTHLRNSRQNKCIIIRFLRAIRDRYLMFPGHQNLVAPII